MVAGDPRSPSSIDEVARQRSPVFEATREGPWITGHSTARGHSPLPEEAVSIARGRVVKLEAAMAAVGEADPTFSHLQEALKKAKAQCQVCPVEDRVVATKDFIERAKKKPKSVKRRRLLSRPSRSCTRRSKV